MKQVVKTLTLSINLLTALLFVFLLTTGYSLFKTLSTDQGLWLGSYKYTGLENSFALSMPYCLNNTGYFDFFDVRLTTQIRYGNATIAESTTHIPELKAGSKRSGVHEIKISLSDLADAGITYLLFNKTKLNLARTLGFSYAHVYSFHLAAPKAPLDWYPPFYSFSLKIVRYDGRSSLLTRVYFENMSPMRIKGKIRLEVFDRGGRLIGVGLSEVDLASGRTYDEQLRIEIHEPVTLEAVGRIDFYFKTKNCTIGPVKIYG
ncbi:hypothetical protein J7L06_06670 [Candidatus Bathyarchaeota archaeon]|nr:hypothetical protein [Candidatus Bathyarchaeota archaeon]